MSHSMLRRCLIVGVLAAVLTTANPAPAQARDLGAAGRVWLWLQDVWTQRLSVLWGGNGSGNPEPKKVPFQAKEGPGFDPNGAPRPASVSPPCGTCTDEGPGFDPNG